MYSAGIPANSHEGQWRSDWQRYALVAGSLLVAVLHEILIPPLVGLRGLFVLFTLAVLASLASGGIRLGVIVTILTAVAITGSSMMVKRDLEEATRAALLVLVLGIAVTLVNRAYARLKAPKDREPAVGGTKAGAARGEENSGLHPEQIPDCAHCDTEQRFCVAQMALSLASWEWEPGSNRLTWSDGGHIFGVGTDPVRTISDWEKLVHGEDLARVRAELGRAVADKSLLHVQYRIARPGGEVRSVMMAGKAVGLTAEGLSRMLGIATDITCLHRAEQDEQVLAALVESSDDAILRHGLDGTIQTWSRGAEEIFGYSREEAIGRPVSILEAGADAAETLDVVKRVAAGERVKNHERIRFRSDGQQVWISQSLAPIRNEAGEVVGIVEVARDISAAKLGDRRIQSLNRDLERRVRARTAQLEDANRMLEAFVYTASHDLRAPLRTIQGLTQALVEDCSEMLDESGKEYARRIVEGTARMDTLIRDLLEYSRLSKRELSISAIPLRVAIEEAIREQGSAIAERAAEIHVADTPMVVLAHELTLVQILSNLISNAIKFAGSGVRPIVNVSAEARGARIRVCIADNGIGIEHKHQARIFEVFERLHVAGEYPGTGIGLAIVRKGIERLGGQVGVESVPGMGSRFWVELPTPAQSIQE